MPQERHDGAVDGSSLPNLDRRSLIHCLAGCSAAMCSAKQYANGAEQSQPNGPQIMFVDTNVSLFRWPFRRLPLDNVGGLVGKLQQLGFAQAWAGSLQGIMHRDLAGVNQRLVNACAEFAELSPIGSINLQLPGWKTDLDHCIARHKMRALRLHPNYHDYDLKDPRVIELFRRATDARMLIQITVAMEDTRTQHRRVRAGDVDVAPMIDWLHRIDGARVQILGHRLRVNLLVELGQIPNVYFDTSRVDGTDAIARLVDTVGSDRVLYGSHSPLLIPEAALIRVYESQLAEKVTLSIMKTNAESVAKGIG